MKYIIFFFLSLFIAQSIQAQQPELDKLFNQLEKDSSFNGSITIAEGGKITYSKAIGLADFRTGERLTDSSIFELASVSKTIIATAIQQLKDKGLLSYKDSLRKFFPELPYSGVIIMHLLEHTSGVADFLYLREIPLDTAKINTNADIIKVLPIAFPTLMFPPGSMNVYSNSNYVLLAAIVEKVSVEPLDAYLRKHIFEPAGMTHTSVYRRLTGAPLPGFAKGYAWSPVTNRYDLPENRGSGRFMHYLDGVTGPYGISSTTGDLVKFHNALQSGLLVSPITLMDAYLRGSLTNGSWTSFGKGWQVVDEKGAKFGKMVFHSGGYSGYRNMLLRYPEKDVVVALLSNTADAEITDILESVEHILMKEPYTIPEKKKRPVYPRLADSTMQQYCGTYKIATLNVSITQEGPVLIFKQPFRAESELIVKGRDHFLIGGAREVHFYFMRDASGKVKSVEIDAPGATQTAVKML